MAEYIKRENVLAEIDEFAKQNIAHGFPVDVFDIEMMKKMVEKLPAADVAPVVHSKWEICCDGYYPYCKRCRNEPQGRVMTQFCPNCGAKMDIDKEVNYDD